MNKICSFCGAKESKQNIIHEGAVANICSHCLYSFNELELENTTIDVEQASELMKPHQIKEYLDEYVVGQEEAKKILSVEVYNHYKRINNKSIVDIQKTNVLLVGPSGSGKTYIIEVLSKCLDIPMVIADATGLTEAGYVGKDIESMVISLLEKCGGDVEKAQKGIVYIDEVDKLVCKGADIGRTRDIGGEGVQQGLLKMIESTDVTVEVNHGIQGKKLVTVNTKDILFICGGAFVGIEDIIKKRLNVKSKKPIGFQVSESKEEKVVSDAPFRATTDDISKYGFIDEFVGRVPLVVTLHKLTENDFIDILCNAKNSIIKQYKALFKMDNIKLVFDKEALKYMAQIAMKQKIGARALRGILADKMNELQYRAPMEDIKEITVTREYLEKK